MKRATKAAMDDWLAELEALNGFRTDAGMTSREIVDATKRSIKWVRDRLRQLHEMSRLQVGRRVKQNWDGRTTVETVYTLRRK